MGRWNARKRSGSDPSGDGVPFLPDPVSNVQMYFGSGLIYIVTYVTRDCIPVLNLYEIVDGTPNFQEAITTGEVSEPSTTYAFNFTPEAGHTYRVSAQDNSYPVHESTDETYNP